MRVADAVVEILKREGVTTLFCFPTTSVIETAVAGGLRPVICRQERVGVDMADGYARVTNGRPPGVFAMQYGPGAENAFPGIATTFSDSVPVTVPAARSCARAGAGVSDVPRKPHLCDGHQAGRTHHRARTGARSDAPRIQPVEERATGTGDGGTAARSAGARHRQRSARPPAGSPDPRRASFARCGRSGAPAAGCVMSRDPRGPGRAVCRGERRTGASWRSCCKAR